ncbi:MAG: photoactive yellow protein [Bradymonadia bacterium]
MSFVNNSTLASLSTMTRSQADSTPHGVVKLADDGTVELYNRWESEMAGVATSTAEGKNFFTQVAPCTNNRLVFGRFKNGVSKGEMDHEFNYTFTYKMKPTNVVLRLFRGSDNSNWVFVTKK